MGITLVRYELNEQIAWGLMRNDMIFSLKGSYPDLDAVLESGMEDIRSVGEQNADQGIPLSHANLLCPVTAPAKILCQSHNFFSIDGRKKPGPSYFTRKDESALVGHQATIRRPQGCRLLEADVSLGLVIGKDIFRQVEITEESLKDYIAGWVICSDLTARDKILREVDQQVYQAKSYRGFCPTGPGIFIPEEEDWKLLRDLEISLWVNDERKIQHHTRRWMDHPASSLSRLSGIIDLKAGDVMLTGTGPMTSISPPSGILKRLGSLVFSEEKRLDAFLETLARNEDYLQDGDRIRTSIKSSDGSVDLGEQSYSITTS